MKLFSFSGGTPTHYKVVYQRVDGSDPTTVEVKTATVLAISNLVPNTEYQVVVTPFNEGFEGQTPSNFLKFTTLGENYGINSCII